MKTRIMAVLDKACLLAMRLRIGMVWLVLTSCMGYKELPVEYDYSYKGQFKKYRTFAMVEEGKTDSDQTSEVIEKSIISRMRFLGYNRSTKRPHLLISYRIFQDSLNLRGYKQPSLDEYLKSPSRVDFEYNPMYVSMNTGTLAIQFYDAKQNRTIWQGYAVGLSRRLDFNNTRHLRNAVISILDQCRVWADGFIEAFETKETIAN